MCAQTAVLEQMCSNKAKFATILMLFQSMEKLSKREEVDLISTRSNVLVPKHNEKRLSKVRECVVVRYDHKTLGISSIHLPFAESIRLLSP